MVPAVLRQPAGQQHVRRLLKQAHAPIEMVYRSSLTKPTTA